MFITMFLSGLWHGAAWNFVFWGIFHGIALAVERIFKLGDFFQKNKFRHFAGIMCCQTTVLLAWVLFRANSLAEAISVYSIMFSAQYTVSSSAGDPAEGPPQTLSNLWLDGYHDG